MPSMTETENLFSTSKQNPQRAHLSLTSGDGEKGQFAFSPDQLSGLIDSKSLAGFRSLGGLQGLENGLLTNCHSGLSVDERIIHDTALSEVINAPRASNTPTPLSAAEANGRYVDRKNTFSDNHLPIKPPQTFLKLLWLAYNDPVLFILTGAAIVSLALGLYQTFTTKHTPSNPPVEWVEGVAILVAIVIIVIVGAANDFQKELKFRKLNKTQQDSNVKVVRSGRLQEISTNDLLVGDVVHVEPGDIIPADGIFIQGYRVHCDESSITGESDLLPKHNGGDISDCTQEQKNSEGDPDPFMMSGTKVVEGVGTFLVIATGINSSHGKIVLTLDQEPEFTPLQLRLNTLAKYIAYLGAAAACFLFLILFIKFLAGLRHSTQTPAEKGQLFLNVFIISLTVVVIAVPEGLPLTVTLALAFATTRMLKDNNLVRRLRACEIMGNATDICSDKTGTLTQNKMTVVSGTIGASISFDNQQSVSGSLADEALASGTKVTKQSILSQLPHDTKSILRQSIALNSTAFEEGGPESLFVGSKTEAALLTFARLHLGLGPLDIERSNTEIATVLPFDASRQCMVTVIQLENGKYRALVKGAPEVLLRKCTRVVEESGNNLRTQPLTDDIIDLLNDTIDGYARQTLRTIGLMFRDFDHWPPAEFNGPDNENAVIEDLLEDLVFLGIIGIKDPLRNGAQNAVLACQKAGINVRMVTGDNILTARKVAEECGILSSPDDLAMEGRGFRELSESQKYDLAPRLKVLARSSPEDKRVLVTILKKKGGIVAVTGDGTNDAPALSAADVGFSMGITGTDMAREASSIVLMDDNFTSIVKAAMWGRAVGDAVKKFLQFQITITVTSVGLAFVSSVASSDEQSVLTAVQLMWINLFQDTLASLALATDPPSPRVLDRKPESKNAPLITASMWKMIIGQSVYQLAVTLILHFAGPTIFSYTTDHEMEELQSAVFNTYVWMQIFMMYINRQLENRFNLFEGLSRNWLFIGVSLLLMGVQILITFVGGKAFSVVPLSGVQWAYSLVLGFLSIPRVYSACYAFLVGVALGVEAYKERRSKIKYIVDRS